MEIDMKKLSHDNSNKRLMKLKDDEDAKTQSSYAQRLENSTRTMQQRYNQAKENRKKICIIGLSDAPNPSRRCETVIKKVVSKAVRKPLLSTVKRSSSCVEDGGRKSRKFQGYGIKDSSSTIGLSKKQDELKEKTRLNEVFKLSYAERAEKVRRKLRQGYDQCQDGPCEDDGRKKLRRA